MSGADLVVALREVIRHAENYYREVGVPTPPRD